MIDAGATGRGRHPRFLGSLVYPLRYGDQEFEHPGPRHWTRSSRHRTCPFKGGGTLILPCGLLLGLDLLPLTSPAGALTPADAPSQTRARTLQVGGRHGKPNEMLRAARRGSRTPINGLFPPLLLPPGMPFHIALHILIL